MPPMGGCDRSLFVCRRPHEATRRTTPCTPRPGPARGSARGRTHHSPPVKVPDSGDENAARRERRGARFSITLVRSRGGPLPVLPCHRSTLIG